MQLQDPRDNKTGGKHNVLFPALLTRALLISVFPPETSLRVRTASHGLHAVGQKSEQLAPVPKKYKSSNLEMVKDTEYFLLNTMLQSCPFQSANLYMRTAWLGSGKKRDFKNIK